MSNIEVFISYSHKDEKMRQELVKHLSVMKRQGVIADWFDRKILPGQEWQREIDDHLNAAHIILILVSADFLSSDYCYDIEMKRAMERHDAGEAKVIPIILRPVDWNGTPFSRLQALPADALPVSNWKNKDAAFTDISKSIRQAIAQPSKPRNKPLNRVRNARPSESAPLHSSNTNSKAERLIVRPRFEDEVANLYKLLGFKVSHDPTVCHRATDLVCELMVRGAPPTKLYLSCYGRTSQNIPSSVVRRFIADYRAIPHDQGFTGAVMVTRSVPKRRARASTMLRDCRLLTFEELFDELLNVTSVLRSYTAWYERQDIYLSYLPLRCTLRSKNSSHVE